MRRKMNLVIALLAMVAMLASCKPDPAPTVKAWDGSVDKAWYNESAASFEISKASELAGLASLVNGGTTFEGKSLILKSDLDLANLEWTPIGQKAGNKFAGSFDGQNHTISNLKITPNEAIAKEDTFDGYAALFGAMDGGTIKNVKVSGSVEGKNVAGLLARMDSGLVENCISYVAVVGTGKAGGIVCLTNNMGCTIQNCTNEG
ncbi:MAG: hypothetical protein SPJ34_05890, partial [Candidatus Ornithospirochaeta sp.]|nr:hypothetical protein [Candidatus Ornithospirochaeta sp.]